MYFLVISLSAEELARSERDLINGYVTSLREYGVPVDDYSFDTAWRQYRAQLVSPLEAAVFTLAYGDDSMSAHEYIVIALQKIVPAILRLNSEEALFGETAK